MPPLTLTYRPVSSSRHAAGGRGRADEWAQHFYPPPLFSLNIHYPRASARSEAIGTFRPSQGLGRALNVYAILYCFIL